jgi:mRNA deadenylase 3'-5' endonuclease subunit Ccr4
VRHIVALGTDVVCLQEVEDETFATVQQAIGPLGYRGHFAKEGGCEAWIICGDLHVTPESHVVAVLRARGFDYTHRTLAGTSTCNANARANMIDYVFYTEALRAQPVAVPVIDDQPPLPSYDQPSDHLALMAHFNWH